MLHYGHRMHQDASHGIGTTSVLVVHSSGACDEYSCGQTSGSRGRCEWSCVCECVNVCIIISSHILYYILVLFWYYCMLLCIHKRWKFTVNTRTLYGVSLECFYIEDSMSTFAVVETFTFSACSLCICHSCHTFYNWKAIDWWLKVLDSV